jgi:transcriptional regulator with XRE-family HTH domain
MDFSMRLKELRKANGFTQISLSKTLGVSKGTVAMWETGKRYPDYKLINQMSDIFDRRIDYILGYSDDDTSPKLTSHAIEQLGQWETQSELIDIFREYLSLDDYGKMNVNSLIKRESVRCHDQGTNTEISNIFIGIRQK